MSKILTNRSLDFNLPVYTIMKITVVLVKQKTAWNHEFNLLPEDKNIPKKTIDMKGWNESSTVAHPQFRG